MSIQKKSLLSGLNATKKAIVASSTSQPTVNAPISARVQPRVRARVAARVTAKVTARVAAKVAARKKWVDPNDFAFTTKGQPSGWPFCFLLESLESELIYQTRRPTRSRINLKLKLPILLRPTRILAVPVMPGRKSTAGASQDSAM
jgi:hypothetical protein